MTTLWLVRHGQTDWNLERRYQGQIDIPLNETGREQARRAAAQLRGRTFDALYASDLARARETAEIIAREVGLPIRPDKRLREISYGDWEGLTVDEVAANGGYRDREVSRLLDDWRAPGGESLGEVADRVWAAVQDIFQAHPGQQVLVVAHGSCLAALLCRVRGLPLSEVFANIPENAAPFKLELSLA